ncbi:Heparan-sulfate 6-O-sulfotransferase 3 [Apostichopus japonicus]|uniref:Heparan-sulfate 6-O-sulfotransferase n=1 Tax=Stichopus japonicus TaxID=307972 RepID=A0A2G8LKB4_STIJA|nr:Heparan-sulfate 6-O-sulfotransferase 3 [Apostichopus japonicus]
MLWSSFTDITTSPSCEIQSRGLSASGGMSAEERRGKLLATCNGREPTPDELPSCYQGQDSWSGVTLEEFINCQHNLARNRQVHMLADLTLVGCYNLSKYSPEERNAIMLESAKANLRRFSYFGLTEFQKESQYIFEETFNLQFKKAFEQSNDTHANAEPLTEEERAMVMEVNGLDIQLYEFAQELFFRRLTYMEEHEGDGILSS